MTRLPQPGSDNGVWGAILNEFLSESLNSDGTLKNIPQAKIDNLATDIADVRSTANTALTTAQQAASGTIADGSVTLTKLSGAVQTSIGKADTALQSAPVTSVATRTGAITLTKGDVGLTNVDNTSDAGKPVSTATQTALDTKADDSAAVHKSGSETIGGAKNFTGGLSANGTAVVVTTDTRLSDVRSPADGSVTTAKIASGGIAESAVTNLTVDLAAKANQSTTYTKTEVDTALSNKASTSSLATVATSGSYADLSNKPAIPNLTPQTLTISTASGSSAAGSVISLLYVESDDAARIRLYISDAARTADAARPVGTQYTGAGLIYEWNPTGWQYDPDGATAAKELPDGNVYWAVTNGVTVTVRYLKLNA